jgi:hypothetical protein
MLEVQYVHHAAASCHGGMDVIHHEDIYPTLVGTPWYADVRLKVIR